MRYPRGVAGRLFVVATPIGNLDDLSPRALEALRRADVVACEDTRRTAKLAARHGLTARLLSCHKFNEGTRVEPILAILREGKDVALVSDGGTPGISDPGALVVRAAREAGATVVPVPGPSSPVALLSASGLPADRFVFDGFLPHRAGERRRRLRELRGERRTVVVLEAPHRIRETLRDAAEILGAREMVLGRELTKVHETILRGSASEILAVLPAGDVPGEITLAFAGAPEGEAARDDTASLRAAWARALDEAGGDRRAALRRLAKETGLGRAELYRRLSELGEDGGA